MSRSDAKAKNLNRGSERRSKPLPDSFTPDRRIIEGSTAELASETRGLLHRRLFAASLVLALGFGVFLVRDLCFPKVSPSLIYLHVGVFLLLILNLLALTGQWRPSMRELRALELVTFGTIAAFFVANQSLGLQARINQDLLTAADLRVLFKTSIIGTLLVIFTYGIFIPNHWKRAACVIVPLALVPLVAPLLLGLTSATFRSVSEEAAHTREAHGECPVPGPGSGDRHLRNPHDQLLPHRGFSSQAAQPVPPHEEARGRGDGRGLPGGASTPEAAVRDQADPSQPVSEAKGAGPVRAGGAGDGPAVALEHRRGLRLRPHRGRHVLLRHGIPAGAEPARARRSPRPLAPRASHLPVAASLRRPSRGS